MTDQLERNLWRYKLYLAIMHTPLFLPIITLFWQENGLDLFDIFVLQGLFSIAIVILEVPTGMIADLIGKRTSLLMGTGILSIGMVVYALGSSFVVFLTAEVIFALGVALISGADSALLYDTLYALGRQNEYSTIEGRARSWQMVSFALSNVLGGLIGNYDYRATIWLSTLGPLIALWLALGFTEVQSAKRENEKNISWKIAWKSYQNLFKDAWKFVRKHQLVRWYILLFSVLSGTGTWLLWLIQPYMKASPLPIWAFGIVFAIFNLSAAFFSRFAGKIQARLKDKSLAIMFFGLQSIPLFLLAWIFHPLGFLFILGQQAVRALARPIISQQVLAYTYKDKRATVLSFTSLGSRLFFALTAPIIGIISKETNLAFTLNTEGFLVLVFFVGLMAIHKFIPSKYFQLKASVEKKG